ncbi:MAG: hypothetical protein AABZ30_08265 [Myxococcota bacterium]
MRRPLLVVVAFSAACTSNTGLCMKTCSDGSTCRTGEGYACMTPPGIPMGVRGTMSSLPIP